MEKKIKHEVKLQKSVIIILGIFSIGILLHALLPIISIKGALADIEVHVGVCDVYKPLCADIARTSSGEALLVKIVE